MPATSSVVSRLLVAAIALGIGMASGQEFPTKTIRIVTSEPGGSADFMTRIIAQGISGPLGQSVILDNRAAALIPEAVSKAPPDGYTLGFVGQGFWMGPLLRKTSYDPIMDFSPVALTNRAPNLLIVHPSLPVKSVKELINLAKSRPGELNYGAQQIGSTSHLAAELFKSMARINIVRVTYKGNAQVVNDILGGHVQLTFSVASSTVIQHIKSGRLRTVGVTSAQPSALVPGVPTVAASLPGYESITTQSIVAPARTPERIINRLNQEIVRALDRPDVKEKLSSNGIEVVGSSPGELAVMMKGEMARMGKVIKDAGIREE